MSGNRDTLDPNDLGEREEGDGATDPESHVEYQPPLSAVPPRVVLHEESQVEVSASPAFQCLDDLFQEGKLTGTRVAQLKAKYTALHDFLKHTRESEAHYLQLAKQYTSVLDGQKGKLEKADEFPENSNSETARLRTTLLSHSNELAMTEERQYQLDYKLECLEEEKKLIEREYSRMPKAGEIEKKIKELQEACDELRREIAQRSLEAKNLREELASRTRDYQMEFKNYEEEAEEVEKLKGDLVDVNSLPTQISKDIDKVNRQRNEVDKRKKNLDADHRDKVEVLKELEGKRQDLVNEKFEVDGNLNRLKSQHEEKERAFELLYKEFEVARDKESALMADRATIDLNLRHIVHEKKTQHDILTRKQREKDRELRNLKKAELQLKVANDNVQHTSMIMDKVKGQALGTFDKRKIEKLLVYLANPQVEVQPKDDGTLLNKRKELQKEVDQTKRALAQQNSLTAVEQVKVEQSIAEEERLLYEQSDLRIEVVELTRLAAIKADEREQKARDFMRAEMRYHRAVEDLKTKQLQIQDHNKKFQEMQQKLKEFAKLYDVIKNERNKCVNLIQTSTQKAAEMREKIKILLNEMEILRTAVAQKERLLQKQRLKHLSSIVIRDSLRNEVAKQQRIEDEMREKREQQKMDINKLNIMINQAEEDTVELRKKYETAVQHRNDRGIQLIERNEEVCIFYEKVNIQETMIRNGDVEMQAREEEIRFLNMQSKEEQRCIDLLRKQVPNKKNLENELTTLQIQLSQCQDRMLELEKNLENPYDESRVRFLEGKDMTPAELQSKVEELETRLAEKEEQLLEKALIFEQVTRLASRVKAKTDNGKDETLSLAKKVNDLQAKIKEVTRKMMATVSELSMQQAEALKLQHVVKEKQAHIEHCYVRMEKGEPPSTEIEAEYQKSLRVEERRLREKEEAKLVAEEAEQYVIAGGVSTTAEPRPNAYIPDDENELPIPRPYGAHAPFKPQEAGSSMRHIRKPVPKPIEI